MGRIKLKVWKFIKLLTVAVVLGDCKAAGMSEFAPGFAWALENPRQVVPVRAKGRLHLWEFDGPLVELSADQCHVEAWRESRSGVVA